MRLDVRLKQQHVALRLAEDRRRLQALGSRLHTARLASVLDGRSRLERAATQLQALSPLRVLDRGYALVYGAKGRLLRSADEVREGETVVAQLAKGRVRATVTRTE